MINKETYRRLTERTKHGIAVLDSEERFVLSCGGYATTKALKRLAELEDKIMDGTLIEIDESIIGQGIIGIHHFTDGTYQLDLDENIVIGFSSDGVITWNGAHHYNDEFRNGMFFMDNEKGKSEAEAKLKELLGE